MGDKEKAAKGARSALNSSRGRGDLEKERERGKGKNYYHRINYRMRDKGKKGGLLSSRKNRGEKRKRKKMGLDCWGKSQVLEKEEKRWATMSWGERLKKGEGMGVWLWFSEE